MKRIAGLAVAALAGCLEPLPDVTRVDALRVLGVQADPPEVPPGAEVALSALVVDPTGAPFSLSWYVCLLADRGQGFFGGGGVTSTSGGEGTPLDTDPDGSSCRAKVAAGRPWAWALGEGESARFTVPPELLDDPAALAVAFGLPEGLAIPDEIAAGLLGIAGLNLTVELIVSSEADEADGGPPGGEIVATRRINVSLDSPLPDNARNLNPSGFSLVLSDDLDASGAPLPSGAAAPAMGRCLSGPTPTLTAGGTYALRPAGFPTEPTPYWVILAGSGSDAPFELKATTETWFHSFFATAGTLEKAISKQPGEPGNTWRLARDEVGPTSLWMVVRDGRGGLAWCSETFNVR
jgi:hypothetical protein